MPKNKGKVSRLSIATTQSVALRKQLLIRRKQGGKNRRRGKNENDNEKRELTFKEEGQGTHLFPFSRSQKTPH